MEKFQLKIANKGSEKLTEVLGISDERFEEIVRLMNEDLGVTITLDSGRIDWFQTNLKHAKNFNEAVFIISIIEQKIAELEHDPMLGFLEAVEGAFEKAKMKKPSTEA
jgi:hypothetical protein